MKLILGSAYASANSSMWTKERWNPQDDCPPDVSCPCLTPVAELPNHEWVMMLAGMHKVIPYATMAGLRNPDAFGMHTYSRALSYGIAEIFENILLDFNEAKGNWQEQWVICQAMMLWSYKGFADEIMRNDDGEQVAAIAKLLRTMFLSMLATLERLDLLRPDSEVKNIATIMGLYFELSNEALFDSVPLTYDETDIGEIILAYANKHKIVLHTPKDNSALIAKLLPKSAEVTLPLSDATHTDPWNWDGDLKTYVKSHGHPTIGGDKYDITTWTPTERKHASYDGKDPFPRSVLNKLKDGLILALA